MVILGAWIKITVLCFLDPEDVSPLVQKASSVLTGGRGVSGL